MTEPTTTERQAPSSTERQASPRVASSTVPQPAAWMGEPSSTTERQARVAALVVGLGALGALGIARWLDPSPTGHSTHLQLGLQPCTFLAVTGWPCPMCGATTTFALLADGRALEGMTNQPFAAFLFLATVVVAGISLADAAWPRGRWRRIGDALRPHEARLAVAFVTAMMLGWIWKIALMKF